ncbi:MAG: tetratricopeptide repeat protein [Opitutaceae bacterium]
MMKLRRLPVVLLLASPVFGLPPDFGPPMSGTDRAGWQAVWRHDYSDALANFQSALRANAKDGEAYGGRAEVEQARGEPRRALADCDLAVRFEPKDSRLWIFRGY